MDAFVLSYLILFATAGTSGAAWYLYSLAFVSTRQQYKHLRLAASIMTPGVLAVGSISLYYGDSLDENWHAAFGYATIIGISGLPSWILSLTVARTAIEAAKNVRIQWKRDDDEPE